MKEKSTIYVRIDYRIEETEFCDSDFNDHIEYLRNVAAERSFAGGGFENEKGGMILFRANSLSEAMNIANNDPLIKRGLYSCKIYEWNPILFSKELEDRFF